MPIDRGTQTAAFLGLDIAVMTSPDARNAIRYLSRGDRFAFVVTPNVDHVVRLSRDGPDSDFVRAYRAAALRLCDSRILARLAALTGETLPVVAGSDLTATLFAEDLSPDDRILIVGGSDDLYARLCARYPALRFTTIAPPMGLASDPHARRDVADAIVRERAHYVFLAVGAPQSELIAAELAQRDDVGGVGLCVGASLEFIAGLKARAPRWMQRAHLEWLHRLLSEPRRLWRRYLIEGPAVFVIVAQWKRSGCGILRGDA